MLKSLRRRSEKRPARTLRSRKRLILQFLAWNAHTKSRTNFLQTRLPTWLAMARAPRGFAKSRNFWFIAALDLTNHFSPMTPRKDRIRLDVLIFERGLAGLRIACCSMAQAAFTQ